MAYADDEKSTEASRPIELYTLVAGATTYRYTSHHSDYVYSGQTYTAIPIQRSAVALEGGLPTREITITLPVTTAFVLAIRGAMPQQGLTAAVDRVQPVSAESRRLWVGSINTFSFSGSLADLRVSNTMDDPLATDVPGYRIQSLCNHQLFDGTTCKVVRATYTVNTTIASFSGNDVTLTSDGGNPDGWATGGELYNTTRNERRMIIAHVGNVVTLIAPFRSGVANGDSVSLYAGCDRSIATCRTKFNNVLNFGGHPHIKGQNIWFTGIRNPNAEE
jgi:uncharacterized phage protein (TIGR02218 family)